MEIRKANIEEFSIIADFQIKMAKEIEDLILDEKTVKAGVKVVFNNHEKGCHYVMTDGNKIVASLLTTYEWSDWRNGTHLWIQSVYVLPEYRGKGVFKQMYKYIKNMVDGSEKYKGIKLYVDISNKSAQKVYESLGMQGEHYKLYEDI